MVFYREAERRVRPQEIAEAMDMVFVLASFVCGVASALVVLQVI